MKVELPEIGDGEDKSSPFKNCIRKNYRHIRKWAKRTVTNCFRIYDRHMHHYPLAIDYYDGRFYVHYFSPHRDEEASEDFVNEVEGVLFDLFHAEPHHIYWRHRVKRTKTAQYEKVDASKEFFQVLEYGIPFWVNLHDYLDTGLFLDHRETRKMVGNLSKGKRVLNLFAYTCSFTVHAALGGASFTKSVDMSNTYTDWGKRNYRLNGISLNEHEIVRADCLKFLDEEREQGFVYDLIVIDPPTLSRSKKMDQMFDVQMDYISLILKSLDLMTSDGILFFSTNSRKFMFDSEAIPGCKVIEISNKTLPIDFHDPRIHRCWKITQ